MKPFSVGERVRIRGRMQKGTVEAYPGKDSTGVISCDRVEVRIDSGKSDTFHPELLIRLKPKKQRVRLELHVKYSHGAKQWVQCTYPHDESTHMGCKHVREVSNAPKKGVRIDREILEKAFNFAVSEYMPTSFEKLCTTLGLNP